MAIISPSTFDPLRGYVRVRLQQGVPIVDADWNELEDVRQFELRAFLKWFVGDGVPQGNDGFRIDGSASLSNDFIIRAGAPPASPGTDKLETGLSHVGRCLVDGLDVIITADINFTAQLLHADQPGSASLSASLGVHQINALTNPIADGSVVVYLDVWERLVSYTEDPSLLHAGLGTESCARIKREWVVRTRAGVNVPVSGDPDYLAGHNYYALAVISRRNGIDTIDAQDITDLREQRLLMPPATLISDLFGTQPEAYRRGEGRPRIDLRSAINAVLRGELPSTPEAALTSDTAEDIPSRSTILDGNGHIWVFWTRSNDIWTRRYVNGAWEAEDRLTTNASIRDREPMALLDNQGDIWLFWQRISSTNRQIWYRRYQQTTRTWDAEVQVPTGTGRAREPYAVEVEESGSYYIWLFYRFGSQVNALRYDRGADTWGTPDPRTSVGSSTDPFALVDTTGRLLLFYEGTGRPGVTGRKIYSQIYSGGTWSPSEDARSDVSLTHDDNSPIAVEDSNGTVWLFWSQRDSGTTNHRAQSTTFDTATGAWSASIDTAFDSLSSNDLELYVLVDSEGGLWLFLANYMSPSSTVLMVTRRPRGSASWGAPMNLTQPGELNRLPRAVQDANETIWLFWQGERSGNRDIYYRQVFPSI